MAERYQPISCDYHDVLEAAAMHKERVEMEFELNGLTQTEVGTVDDVYTANGAEFVKFGAPDGAVDIRLDQIISMRRV